MVQSFNQDFCQALTEPLVVANQSQVQQIKLQQAHFQVDCEHSIAW